MAEGTHALKLYDNDHYVGVLAQYSAQYAGMDAREIAQRCGVPFDADAHRFALVFLGEAVEVSYPEFACHAARELSNTERILLLRYLTCGRFFQPMGGHVPYRELTWGDVYQSNFEGRCIKRLAHSYGGRLEAFKKAAAALGAAPVPGGDIACEIKLLPGLSVRLILWDGDDEFPPNAQILFSDNFKLAFTAEDAAVACDIIIDRLKAEN